MTSNPHHINISTSIENINFNTNTKDILIVNNNLSLSCKYIYSNKDKLLDLSLFKDIDSIIIDNNPNNLNPTKLLNYYNKNSFYIKYNFLNNIDEIPQKSFINCHTLTNVSQFPGNFSKLSDKIFMGCNLLKSVNLNNITEIGNHTFDGCSSLSLNISNIVKFGEYSLAGTKIYQANLNSEVEELSPFTFENCQYLTKVSFNNTEHPLSIYEGAFAGCSDLQLVNISYYIGKVSDQSDSIFGIGNNESSKVELIEEIQEEPGGTTIIINPDDNTGENNNPTNPDNPTNPEEPNPDTPTDPDNPTNPEEPNPDTPTDPTTPDTPISGEVGSLTILSDIIPENNGKILNYTYEFTQNGNDVTITFGYANGGDQNNQGIIGLVDGYTFHDNIESPGLTYTWTNCVPNQTLTAQHKWLFAGGDVLSPIFTYTVAGDGSTDPINPNDPTTPDTPISGAVNSLTISSSEASENGKTLNYTYEFTQNGNDVTITFGYANGGNQNTQGIAGLVDGYTFHDNIEDSGLTYTWMNCQPGQILTAQHKWLFAGGDALTPIFTYTLPNDGNNEQPNLESHSLTISSSEASENGKTLNYTYEFTQNGNDVTITFRYADGGNQNTQGIAGLVDGYTVHDCIEGYGNDGIEANGLTYTWTNCQPGQILTVQHKWLFAGGDAFTPILTYTVPGGDNTNSETGENTETETNEGIVKTEYESDDEGNIHIINNDQGGLVETEYESDENGNIQIINNDNTGTNTEI